jgi:hypothetical protein
LTFNNEKILSEKGKYFRITLWSISQITKTQYPMT